MIALAQFTEEHCEALEYDLLTRTSYQLEDIGDSLSWGALGSFIANLRTDSALARDLGKQTGWEETIQTNRLLADIYDMLQVINANLIRMGGGKKKKFKPYPRPGKDHDTKKIGKGALPYKDLVNWIKERQKHG